MEDHGLCVHIKKVHKIDNGSSLKAYVDIIINEAILIKNFKVMDGKHGRFVSLPMEKGKDQKWYETVKVLDKDVQKYVSSQVLESYSQS